MTNFAVGDWLAPLNSGSWNNVRSQIFKNMQILSISFLQCKTTWWLHEICFRSGEISRSHGTHHRPDDRGSKHLRNVGKLLTDYTRNITEDSHLHTFVLMITGEPSEIRTWNLVWRLTINIPINCIRNIVYKSTIRSVSLNIYPTNVKYDLRLWRRSELKKLSSGLLRRVVIWLHTNVSEEHATTMFRVEVRRVRKLMGLHWLYLPSPYHGSD
jgi:hypothetical protein